MGKPTSALSTAISIRIPNDLLDTVAEYALSQGLINESGRQDKRGQPNLSAAVTNLLKRALEPSEPKTSLSSTPLSDSVIGLTDRLLKVELEKIEHSLVDRVCNAVTQQLSQFLSDRNIVNAGAIANSTHPAKSLSQSDPQCEPNATGVKEDTKDRILHAVSRGFRSKGYNGVGVDTLAKNAGVTSGAFYGYFRSKEDAFLAAVVDGIDEYRAGIETFRAKNGTNWPVALADYYVGRKHRQDLACGCALPTLSPEVIRADERVRAAYQTELMKLNDAIAAGLGVGTAIDKRDTAWVILSLLTGGVTLARAVWDEALSEQIAAAIHDATITFAAGKLETHSVTDPQPI
jgi:TetR/AcrR family transcriptional regulator, transcriptional repressor for nem operon